MADDKDLDKKSIWDEVDTEFQPVEVEAETEEAEEEFGEVYVDEFEPLPEQTVIQEERETGVLQSILNGETENENDSPIIEADENIDASTTVENDLKQKKFEKVADDDLTNPSEAYKILKKRRKKHFRFFNFSRKLIFLTVIPIVLICVITTISSSSILRKNLEEEIESSLKIVAVNLEETYSALYEGDYHSDLSGGLYKGETKISKNTSLIDALKEETGCECSFYYGDVCTISTVKRQAGGRITGLRIDKELYEELNKNPSEDSFRRVVIDEVKYYAYYRALINEDGTAIGYIFAAKPSTEVNKNISKETTKLIVVAVLLSGVGIVLIFVFAMALSKNMVKTKDFISVIATGDLTQDAKARSLSRDDELGDIYVKSYELQEELKRIVSSIKFSAMELASSSDNLLSISKGTTMNVNSLYDSVEAISRGASSQAEQTSVAAIQVSNIGDQIENISDEIVVLSNTASNMARAEQESKNIINDLNETNNQMIDSINKIAIQIDETSQSIQGIQSTVEMIKAITEETDLLSINASIEASHAGEAGKGFAVVAEQISKLALQSGKNATQINDTINKLLEESAKMVEYMDDVKIKIDNQKEKLDMTVNTFSLVANGVGTSLSNINSISNGMDELRNSRDVILDVISNLSAVSEEYAASTTGTIETAKGMSDAMETLEIASQQLKKMSDSLYEELDIFKL